jgi:hypothetical protein
MHFDRRTQSLVASSREVPSISTRSIYARDTPLISLGESHQGRLG